jgi:hypothetical protein
LMEMVLNSTWTLIRSAVMLMMNSRQVGCCVSYLIWHPCAPVHPGRCVSASIGHHQSLHVLGSPIKFSLVAAHQICKQCNYHKFELFMVPVSLALCTNLWRSLHVTSFSSRGKSNWVNILFVM